MLPIVPSHKHDHDACDRLALASDKAVEAHLPELLEWLQDMNWPVAQTVLGRIKTLEMALVEPIKGILNSDDPGWKYWIVAALLPETSEHVRLHLNAEIQRLAKQPTEQDAREEVDIVAQELLDLTQPNNDNDRK